MAIKKREPDHIVALQSGGGVDRRAFLLRMAWACGLAWFFVAGEPTASAEETVNASIANFAFDPKQLTVKAGTTVNWTNKDDTPHTVTSDSGVFSSPGLDTNESFHFTFQKPGKFPYHCKLHPNMTGVVEVQ